MTTPTHSRIARLLNRLDQVSDRLGSSVPQIVDLEQLQPLPADSFGHHLVDFLAQHQLQPFTSGPRRKQLHDCVHVLTGYGADPVGEAEIQAFLLGAKWHPANVLLGLGLLRLIHRHVKRFPLLQPEIRHRLLAAYQRGQHAHFDPDTWQPETLWQQPLASVQAMFQVEPMNP